MSLKYLNLSGLEDLWINIKNYILSKVPTKTSELTNDSGYLTSHQSLSNYVTLNTAQEITSAKTFKNTTVRKLTSVEAGNVIPSSDKLLSDIWQDKNGKELGRIYFVKSKSGTTELIMRAGDWFISNEGVYTLDASGTNRRAELHLYTDSSGNCCIKPVGYFSATLKPLNSSVCLAEYGKPFGVAYVNQVRFTNATLQVDVDIAATEEHSIGFFGKNNGPLSYIAFQKRPSFKDRVAIRVQTSSSAYKSYDFDSTCFYPESSNSVDIGSTTNIFKNIYCNNYYKGTTAFGDIVTHNASEFLTSHQSLSNYVTLDGTQTIAGTKTFSSTISGSISGNAGTATQFSANTTVALTGDATGTSAGSKKGWSVPVTLANSGVTAGTYGPSADVTGNNNATISVPEITVDAKGRVTSVTNRTLTCKNNTYNVYNKKLTIQKNGTNVATFTSNSNTDVTANITVPTKVSELTNDSGYLTSHQSLSNYVTIDTAQDIEGNKNFKGLLTTIPNDTIWPVTASTTDDITYLGANAIHVEQKSPGKLTDLSGGAWSVAELGVGCFFFRINNGTDIRYKHLGQNTVNRIPVVSGANRFINDVTPNENNTYSLGTSSLRWSSCYSNAYYLGTTAFGDIVTHNASEFLTQHQSLANYVTTNTSQSISGIKTFPTNIDLANASTSQREYWALKFSKTDTNGTGASQIGVYQPSNSNDFVACLRLGNPRGGNKPTTGTGVNTGNCWSGIGVYYNYALNRGYPYAPSCNSWSDSSNADAELASTAWVRRYCETTKGFLTSHQSLANYALDANVVHTSGNETVGGVKRFTNDIIRGSVNTNSTIQARNIIGNTTTSTAGSNSSAYQAITATLNYSDSTPSKSVTVSLYVTENAYSDGKYSSFRSSSNNLTNLGTSEKKWANVYATNYYYGANSVEFSDKFVTTDTAQTISGVKSFSGNTYITSLNFTNEVESQSSSRSAVFPIVTTVTYTDQSPSQTARLNFRITANGDKSLYPHENNQYSFGVASRRWTTLYGYLANLGGTYVGNEASANERTNLYLLANRDTDGQSGAYIGRFRQNRAQGAMSGGDVSFVSLDFLENSTRYTRCFTMGLTNWDSDGVPQTYYLTASNGKGSLGTSTNKWSTINGLTPSSLSLPDLANGIDISSYLDVSQSSTNNYTPPANGWISISINTPVRGSIQIECGGGFRSSVLSCTDPDNSNLYIASIIVPCIKNDTATIYFKSTQGGTIKYAYFYPCQGNV